MSSMTPNEVIELLANAVKGRYPCVSGVIGQLILEVGFGLKTPKDISTGRESYNLGNIKGNGTAGSVTIHTKEYYTAVQIDAARRAGTLIQVIGPDKRSDKTIVVVRGVFRAYHNYGEAIEDHFQLLKKPRYVRAGLWDAKTPEAFAKALKTAGYATDTAYVEKILAIVKRYKLQKYDEGDYEMKKEDANKLIDTYLKPAWGAANAKGDAAGKAEANRLANELRKASGQPVQ